ncbi:MAG: hypothetical protein ACLUOI_17160 [Eisenbergiella sp.]
MEIKDRLSVQLSQSRNGGVWQTVSNGWSFPLTYKRGNAAVCGVFSMNDRMEGLKHAVGEGAGVYIVEDGMPNGIDGKEDKFGIVEETKKQEKVFRYWRDNQYVYGLAD